MACEPYDAKASNVESTNRREGLWNHTLSQRKRVMTRMANERATTMGMSMGSGMAAMDMMSMGMMRGMAAGMGSMPSGMNMGMGMGGSGMMMVPRCTVALEKLADGMRMTCTAEDPMARTMMQNLCMMMSGGAASCAAMMNGMCLMTCNLAVGMVRCEMAEGGMMMACTSGDRACAAMIMACCDAMTAMMQAGCACCVMMNGMPVCCGR